MKIIGSLILLWLGISTLPTGFGIFLSIAGVAFTLANLVPLLEAFLKAKTSRLDDRYERAMARGSFAENVAPGQIGSPIQSETKVSNHLYHPGNLYDEQVSIIIRDDIKFAILDFETTGLYPESGDRAIQVAVLTTDHFGNEIDRWSTFIQPGRKISNSHIHGITNDMLTQAPRFGDIADILLKQLNGKIIVGHNVSFDLRFLESELNRVNIQLDPRAIAVFDTMSLTSLLGHLPNKKMGTVARAIGVNFDSLDGRGEHDALTDVIAESMVLQRYFKEKADAVWYLVKFPRYKGGFVRFLTRSDHQEMLAKDDAWDVIAKRVKEQEPIELTLAKGSEVYLSSVTWGQISKYEQLLTESGLVLAKSLTKSRTKVVVMGGFDTRSDTLHKADRWGIPVITVENLHLLKVSE